MIKRIKNKALKPFKQDEGLALTELIVALFIVGLVIAIVILIQWWGTTSFQAAETMAILQKEVRAVAGKITDEVRYARSIYPLEGMESTPEDSYCYLYLDDGVIVNIVGDETRAVVIDSVVTSLRISGSHIGQNYVLRFTIEAEKDGVTYSLDSSVMAENIDERPPWGAGWTALKYRFD